MGYKNKTNQEYQNDYYLENKYRKQQYYNQNYKRKRKRDTNIIYKIEIIYEYINIYIIVIKNMKKKEI